MWTLTVMIKGQQPATLMFKTREAAEEALAIAETCFDKPRIKDDFGRVLAIDEYSVGPCLLQDVEQAMEADRLVKVEQFLSEQKFREHPDIRREMANQMRMQGLALPGNRLS